MCSPLVHFYSLHLFASLHLQPMEGVGHFFKWVTHKYNFTPTWNLYLIRERMNNFNIWQWKEIILLLILEGLFPSTEHCSERTAFKSVFCQFTPYTSTLPQIQGPMRSNKARSCLPAYKSPCRPGSTHARVWSWNNSTRSLEAHIALLH